MKKPTCGITSQDKLWLPGVRRFISTLNVSGPNAKVSALLLLALLMLSLTLNACSASTTQPKRKVVQLHMEMWEKPEQVSKACRALGAKTPKGAVPAACAQPLGRGRWRLILRKPTSFCDWETMKTWGHELMHTFSMDHSNKYLFIGGPNHWTGQGCAITDGP